MQLNLIKIFAEAASAFSGGASGLFSLAWILLKLLKCEKAFLLTPTKTPTRKKITLRIFSGCFMWRNDDKRWWLWCDAWKSSKNYQFMGKYVSVLEKKVEGTRKFYVMLGNLGNAKFMWKLTHHVAMHPSSRNWRCQISYENSKIKFELGFYSLNVVCARI